LRLWRNGKVSSGVRDNLLLFSEPGVAARDWLGRLLLSAFIVPEFGSGLLSARCSYMAICVTSCADMISHWRIRCTDRRFNHEPGRQDRVSGVNYNQTFAAPAQQYQRALGAPEMRYPGRKRKISSKVLNHTRLLLSSHPFCEILRRLSISGMTSPKALREIGGGEFLTNRTKGSVTTDRGC
jgi:hypothetical protein